MSGNQKNWKQSESSSQKKRKPWPKGCVWPEPLWNGEGGTVWDEDFLPLDVDEDAEYYTEVKGYFDGLVRDGRLDEEYCLSEEYYLTENDEDPRGSEEDEAWIPEIGEEYWDGERFLVELWEEDLTDHMNLLKIDTYGVSVGEDPVVAVRNIIDYEFVNENLLRQAFTRRAFQVEYGLAGCNEELEFLGDTVLGTVVTREIFDHLTRISIKQTDAPFEAKAGYAEGELTRLKSHFVSKEYLSARAVELGLDQFILYGIGEEPSESSREDMMEALIGAVMIDCGWDWDVIEGVVDKLIRLQLNNPDEYLKKSYYDIFNAWHQRHFGVMPDYELNDRYHKRGVIDHFQCILRFRVPENDKGVRTARLITAEADTRSRARDLAAMDAYQFVKENGLWINLADAGIEPDMDKSINQLQELFQKKYVDQPLYEFTEGPGDQWRCDCICNDVSGFGHASSKTAAKKKAAFMVLVLLLKAAGCCEDEWLDQMYGSIGRC